MVSSPNENVVVGISLVRRIATGLIDGGSLVLGMLGSSLIAFTNGLQAGGHVVAIGLFCVAYWVLGWGIGTDRFSTLGMSLMRVRFYSPDSGDLSWVGYGRRILIAIFFFCSVMISLFFYWLPFLLRVVLLSLMLMSLVYSLIDARRRAFHDVLAGSLLVGKSVTAAQALPISGKSGVRTARRMLGILLLLVTPGGAALLVIGVESLHRALMRQVNDLASGLWLM